MHTRLYKAHGSSQWHVLCNDSTDYCRQGAYWTEVGVARLLVQYGATLSVLLVVHGERHRGCCGQSHCIAGEREQGLALPKAYVAQPKLDSASGLVLGFESVFAHPEQKIECYHN